MPQRLAFYSSGNLEGLVRSLLKIVVGGCGILRLAMAAQRVFLWFSSFHLVSANVSSPYDCLLSDLESCCCCRSVTLSPCRSS